jgi:hypothetical protein
MRQRFHVWCEDCGFRAARRIESHADTVMIEHRRENPSHRVFAYEFFTESARLFRRARKKAYMF